MKTKQLLKEIKGVFVLPIRKYYLGGIKYYTPYFYPVGFNDSIIKIRKLKLKSQEKYQEYIERFPNFKDQPVAKFTNLPMVRRNKYWIIKNWYIEIGWPFAIANSSLGWKDKYDSPRFEWNPFWQFWFFKWQFVINWIAPDNDQDSYWEQVLWYLHYSDKDIKKAKETWPWTNIDTEQSTWNDKYLL